MPITVVKNLPAIEKLAKENIFVMDTQRAETQDIRPLRIVLVNLMPTKEATETQILRALSNTPIQIELTLVHTESYASTNTDEAYLESFYKTFSQIKDEYFDGLIITGAPVELMPFEDVQYWAELVEIMEWSETHTYSTLHICWGAQAGMYYHYGIHKELLPEKLFGVYENKTLTSSPMLLRGLDEVFYMPHSRNTTVNRQDIIDHPSLEILAESEVAGVSIARSVNNKHIFFFGHAEYDGDTLEREYLRDLHAGVSISLPENYYPNNNQNERPIIRWRSAATLLFTNWLNYYVYQETPYIVEQVKQMKNRVSEQS